MFKPQCVLDWDKNCLTSEFVEVDTNKKSYGLIYVAQKKQFTFQSRDFYEKGINFYSNGKYYRYTCGIPNDSDFRSIPKDTVRGQTLINCAIMEYQEDGKLSYRCVTQCDFKMTVPNFIYTTFLPKAAKSWLAEIQKYY